MTCTTGGGIFRPMSKSDKIFWGLVTIAGFYLLVGQSIFSPFQRTTTSYAASALTQPAPTGGHIMPNGQRMTGGMGGMGCTMGANGGGCGCGGGGAR
ncbi:MAG: hypothetical protein WCG83_03585 [Candidatus Peregrinibacteria bacterium]